MTEEEKTKILGLGEIDTYFMIDECGAFMFRMTHDMNKGRIPEESHDAIKKDVEGVRELQRFAVDNLTRFEIDPDSAKDKENGDYWKWYSFWDNWKKGLSDEDWRTVNRLMSNDESIEEYLPKGTWRN